MLPEGISYFCNKFSGTDITRIFYFGFKKSAFTGWEQQKHVKIIKPAYFNQLFGN